MMNAHRIIFVPFHVCLEAFLAPSLVRWEMLSAVMISMMQHWKENKSIYGLPGVPLIDPNGASFVGWTVTHEFFSQG